MALGPSYRSVMTLANESGCGKTCSTVRNIFSSRIRLYIQLVRSAKIFFARRDRGRPAKKTNRIRTATRLRTELAHPHNCHWRAGEFFSRFKGRPGRKRIRIRRANAEGHEVRTLQPSKSFPPVPVWVKTLAVDFSEKSPMPWTCMNSPAVDARAGEHDTARSRDGASVVKATANEPPRQA
jgi:hypothetical protein